MSAREVDLQLMGTERKGWLGLRPQKDPQGRVWSVFKNRFLKDDEGQTIVEALATLIFENTLRILPYRNAEKKDVPETVLGHAAAAHGGTLDANAQLWELRKQVERLQASVDAILNTGKR